MVAGLTIRCQLERPTMKSAEGPERQCKTRQEPGKDSQPHNHEVFGTGGRVVVRTRDLKFVEKQISSPAVATSQNVAAQHEGEVFTPPARPGTHHLGLALRAAAVRSRLLHDNLFYRVGPSFGSIFLNLSFG